MRILFWNKHGRFLFLNITYSEYCNQMLWLFIYAYNAYVRWNVECENTFFSPPKKVVELLQGIHITFNRKPGPLRSTLFRLASLTSGRKTEDHITMFEILTNKLTNATHFCSWLAQKRRFMSIIYSWPNSAEIRYCGTNPLESGWIVLCRMWCRRK